MPLSDNSSETLDSGLRFKKAVDAIARSRIGLPKSAPFPAPQRQEGEGESDKRLLRDLALLEKLEVADRSLVRKCWLFSVVVIFALAGALGAYGLLSDEEDGQSLPMAAAPAEPPSAALALSGASGEKIQPQPADRSDPAARSQTVETARFADDSTPPVAASSATPATSPEAPNDAPSVAAANAGVAPAASDDKIPSPPANASDFAARPQTVESAPSPDASTPVVASSATPGTSPEARNDRSWGATASADAVPSAQIAARRQPARSASDREVDSDKEIDWDKIPPAVVEHPPAPAAAAQALAPRDREASPAGARISNIRREPTVHSNPIVGYAGPTATSPRRQPRRSYPQSGRGRSSEVGLASSGQAGSGAIGGGFGAGPTGGMSSRSLAGGPATIKVAGSTAPLAGEGAKVRLAMKQLCPTISADPSSYDDELVLLCRPSGHI